MKLFFEMVAAVVVGKEVHELLRFAVRLVALEIERSRQWPQ